MDRTKFYNRVTVDGVLELDKLHNTLSNFLMRYEVSYYRTVDGDVMRPDMISFKVYGTVRYWWLICLVNGIVDPLQGIVVGMLLKIPNLLDIYDFYKRYHLR